jgi:molybdate transport system regulatory protein
MAGSKGAKYFDVFLDYKFWLQTKEGNSILGQGVVELLKNIKTEGSIQKAAIKSQISYRKAWGNIKKAEEILQFSIVEKKRGGVDGGKSLLTPDGENLLTAFEELKKGFDQSIYDVAKRFFRDLNTKKK